MSKIEQYKAPVVEASLPIIDLSKVDNPATRDEFYKDLGRLVREVGFFYIVGHGIELQTIKEFEIIAKEFFALPQEEKDRISIINSPNFRGYIAADHEITLEYPDHREQIDIGEEAATLPKTADSPAWENLQGPNQWPEGDPEFKEKVLQWQSSVRGVAIKLLKAVLVALGQTEDALDDLINGIPSHTLKIIHSPGSDDPRDAQGVGPHKDGGILTVLLQDDIGGLQVLTSDGWIDIPYVEGAFVINIGEILELVTNGYLRANVHQVITPKAGIDRYSIAYFLQPRLAAGTLPILKLPEHLASLARGPETDPKNPLFDHVGTNALKFRLRSHPDVAKKYYPDEYKLFVSKE